MEFSLLPARKASWEPSMHSNFVSGVRLPPPSEGTLSWANQLLTRPVSHCPQLVAPLELSANFKVQERALPDCQMYESPGKCNESAPGTPQAPARKTVYFLKMSWDFRIDAQLQHQASSCTGNRSAHLNTNRLTTKRRRNRGDHGQRPPRQLPAETALFRRRISTGNLSLASICA